MDSIKQFEPLWGVWKTEALIGEGSYGKVYRAVREEFGRKYYAAVKHISIPTSESQITEAISEGVADDNESVKEYFDAIAQNLINEISLMNDVKGKTNIVSYEDHLIIPKSSGVGYDIIIRMELLTGLNDILRHKQLTNKDVIKLGIDLCSALEVCVEKGIVHRDIKPSNIFVSDNGDYKLGDFGVARELEHTTSAMSKKGTYIYMAPEVYRGESANFSADIFSLGIVMYRLLNGNRAPFLPVSAKVKPGDNENALARRMSGEQMPAPAFAEEGLAQIILKATQFDRTKRYALPIEMKNDLIRLSGGTVMERTVPIIAEPTHSSVSFQKRHAAEDQGTVILFPEEKEVSRFKEDNQGNIIIFPDEQEENSGLVHADVQRTILDYSAQHVSRSGYANTDPVNRTVQNRAVNSNVKAMPNYHVSTEENDRLPIYIIAGVASALLIMVLVIVASSLIRKNKYNSYIEQYDYGNYESARSGFESMGDYEQSKEYVLMCDYNIAKNEIKNGNYDEAISILEGLDGYSDSADLIKDANYKKATALLSSGAYEDAKSIFKDLGYYSDSISMVKECDYQKAINYYENSDYYYALSMFKSLHQYKKSAEYVALCDFYNAKTSKCPDDFDEIDNYKKIFENLSKFANTNSECKKCCSDGFFTFMKLFDTRYSYSGISIKLYGKDSRTWINHKGMWDANFKYYYFDQNKGKYGFFTHTKGYDESQYVDWFEIVDFDDPYTDKPSTVTIKNPNNGKEYTLKRQG